MSVASVVKISQNFGFQKFVKLPLISQTVSVRLRLRTRGKMQTGGTKQTAD